MPASATPRAPDSPTAPEPFTVEFTSRAVLAMRTVAATEILPRFRAVTARRKDDGSLVTEADYAAQRALAAALARIAPVEVLGEEMEESEQRRIWAAGGRFWCIDPLDGTANFSAGVPYFAVSAALMQDDRPVFGVVVDPIADEAYFAVRGAGAWRDGFPLRPPALEIGLREAVAEVDLRRAYARVRHDLKHRLPCARRVTSGSSALAWCHLAAGRRDLLLHAGQKVWDYAAGALIAEEAGARTATLVQDDFWAGPAWERSVIAARTPALFTAWRDWVRARTSVSDAASDTAIAPPGRRGT